MYCEKCGALLDEDARFCSVCGEPILTQSGADANVDTAADVYDADANSNVNQAHGTMGFSRKIDDPAFKKYVKNSNRYAVIFSLAIAFIAIIGFYIAGERGVEGMSNPESLYIGLGIGSMFILIALFQVLGRKRSKTWDGVVIDKIAERKKKKVSNSDNTTYTKTYMSYKIVMKDDHGKRHERYHEDDSTVFDYYKVGDRIRHHGGLNSYEKFDKANDTIIFCAACATLCDMTEDYCPRCKCPLLK